MISNSGSQAGYSATTDSGKSIVPSPSENVYHLIRPTDYSRKHCHASITPDKTYQVTSELCLNRLLDTKKGVQKFVDEFFLKILTFNVHLPPFLKWLFDLFDDAAKKYNVTDPEVVHSWKCNRYV